MANPLDSVPLGIADALGVPNSAKVPANTRVRTSAGFVGVMGDVPVWGFPTATGQWTLAATRCRANGLPVVTQSSVGVGIASTAPLPPTTGPIRVQIPFPRVRAS